MWRNGAATSTYSRAFISTVASEEAKPLRSVAPSASASIRSVMMGTDSFCASRTLIFREQLATTSAIAALPL